MSNAAIKKNLEFRENRALTILNANKNLSQLHKSILYDLYMFDFTKYTENLVNELSPIIETWKLHYKNDNPIDAIVYKYGLNQEKSNESSFAISNWKSKKVYTDLFSLSSPFDFDLTFFFGHSIISTSFLDGLKALDKELLKDYESSNEELNHVRNLQTIEDIEEFSTLIQLHRYKGMIAIHDALMLIDGNNTFEGLNYNDNFMFLIHQQNSLETYPLLIKKKK